MVLNLVSLASRLQEPFHTGAVVKLPGATAGAGPTTGLAAGGGGVGAEVVVVVGAGVGGAGLHGAVMHGTHAVLYLEDKQSLPEQVAHILKYYI